MGRTVDLAGLPARRSRRRPYRPVARGIQITKRTTMHRSKHIMILISSRTDINKGETLRLSEISQADYHRIRLRSESITPSWAGTPAKPAQPARDTRSGVQPARPAQPAKAPQKPVPPR